MWTVRVSMWKNKVIHAIPTIQLMFLLMYQFFLPHGHLQSTCINLYNAVFVSLTATEI